MLTCDWWLVTTRLKTIVHFSQIVHIEGKLVEKYFFLVGPVPVPADGQAINSYVITDYDRAAFTSHNTEIKWNIHLL